MDTNSFGYRLKQARLALGVSQPVICEKVGLKVSALSRYERGDSTGLATKSRTQFLRVKPHI
jgi:transcriptional regulator with XRE-family HTH domain